MKTILAGLLALLLTLAAAGTAWWYLHHPRLPASAAAYLPPDTLFYAEIPDGTQTFLRFQASQLQGILGQEETRGVLGLIFARCGQFGDGAGIDPETAAHLRAAGNEWLQALGGQSFLAVTRFDWDTGKHPGFPGALQDLGLVAGFHNSPADGAHVEALWRELLAAWRNSPDAVTPGNALHGAIPYTYLELKGTGIRICRARWKEWSLITVGEAPLADFLDRAAAVPTPAPSLKTAPDYAAVMGQLDPASDALFYVDLHQSLEIYRKVLAAFLPSRAASDGTAWDVITRQIGFMHASAGSLAFRDGVLVDRCVVAAPQVERGGMGPHFAPVALASTRFTTPATVFYGVENLDPEAYYNQQVDLLKSMQATAAANGTPPPPNPYQTVETQLKAQGIDLHENVLRALGPELAVIVDWPAGQELPDVLLAWAVRDKEKFAPAYDKLVQTLSPLLPMVGKVEPLALDGFQGLVFTPKQLPVISPTVFAGPDFFGLSLTGAGARRLLAAGHPPLDRALIDGPIPGAPRSGPPYALAYLDLASVAGRGYAAGKPFLPKYLAGYAPGTDWAHALPSESKAAPLLGTLRAVAWNEGDFLRSDIVSPEGAGLLGGVAAAGMLDSVLHRSAPAVSESAMPTIPPAASAPALAPAP